MKFVSLLFAAAMLASVYAEHNYKIHIKKAEFTSINEAYGSTKESYLKVKPHPSGLLTMEALLVLKKDFPQNAQVEVVGYKENSPGNFVHNFRQGPDVYCKYLKENVIIMKNVLDAANFTDCPPQANTYVIQGMTVDEKSFPENIPTGAVFKIELRIFTAMEDIMSLVVMASIVENEEEDERK